MVVLKFFCFNIEGVIMHCRKEWPKGGHYMYIVIILPAPMADIFMVGGGACASPDIVHTQNLPPTPETLHCNLYSPLFACIEIDVPYLHCPLLWITIAPWTYFLDDP